MHNLNLNGKILSLEEPIVMGIINLTTDSFYAGSRKGDLREIFRLVEKMLDDGVSVIDIGAVSSRPGGKMIPVNEELDRILPVVKALINEFPEIVLSIDTYRSEVVRQLAEITSFIVNDISGFAIDNDLLEIISKNKLPYILMHIKGNPENMIHQTDYEDLIFEMLNYFGEKLSFVRQMDISQIILDPGIGFSKTLKQNFEIIKMLSVFNIFEYPLMVGVSRKSFIYNSLNSTPDDALNGTTAMHMAALLNGAKILRVHDVKEAVETVKLFQNLTINVND